MIETKLHIFSNIKAHSNQELNYKAYYNGNHINVHISGHNVMFIISTWHFKCSGSLKLGGL